MFSDGSEESEAILNLHSVLDDRCRGDDPQILIGACKRVLTAYGISTKPARRFSVAQRREWKIYTDEIDDLKSRRDVHTENSLEAISMFLAGSFGGPVFDQTYAQQCLYAELISYQSRRKRIFGIPMDDRETLYRKAGYVKRHAAGILQRMWNRGISGEILKLGEAT